MASLSAHRTFGVDEFLVSASEGGI
jgi:hypothetical protein